MQQRIDNLLRSIDIQSRLDKILQNLGEYRSTSNTVAYDTAWVARLIPYISNGNFDSALHWLRTHQHEDGSWGGEITHYHDRIVSTLAALLALQTAGSGYEDELRIRAGEKYLWSENARIAHDAHDTIGFPVLAIALVKEAEQLGLDVPANLYSSMDKVERKLNLLGPNPDLWRNTSLIFSFEALRIHVPFQIDFDFSEPNGSIAASPSATVAALLSSQNFASASVSYLEDILAKQGDCGLAFVHPFDIFESAWTLNVLQQAGLVAADDPRSKHILDFLWSRWAPDCGLSFSSFFHVPDLDDTAVTFAVLRRAGYPVEADVFQSFEEASHFRCYPGEIDLSLSANIRTLAALQLVNTHPKYEKWVNKIIALLRRSELTGYFWFDKWHISPYYLTCTAVSSLYNVADDLLGHRIKWILKTQRKDGGWGYYQQSTAEETAYCLQTLLLWDRVFERIDPAILKAAIHYLLHHLNDVDYPEQWLAKSVYTPLHLVEATILGAVHSYKQYAGF